ncbi:hypothetical protein PHLCEN_2v3238 [Hermanssonia centrifuga]|uniref:Uncharacterized protein n=1 Tax=Hermanssonia centrifuga TaxID=98765 RepID=A0A2R6QXK2_9APHY|nr:hypothetical protein PHLCEN_2v3238 [Hermanssonia centrifuga]
MEAVVDRTSTSLPKPQLKNLEQQCAHADKLSYNCNWRDVVMLNTDTFIESVHALDPLKKILRAYHQAEETLIPDTKSAMQGLYSEFAKDLIWILDALTSKTMMTEEIWASDEPVVVTVAKETSKRKRDSEGEGEDKDEPEVAGPDAPRSQKRARKIRHLQTVDGPAARTRARLEAR